MNRRSINRRSILGLCGMALISIPTLPNSGVAQVRSLKDQLIGTWIYVSGTVKSEDGSVMPRPSAQGAVTYTADGRFHFITVRTGMPRYASGDPSRPSPEEAMAVASGVIAYTGTYALDESTKTAHLNIETSSVSNFVGDPNQRRTVTSITDAELIITNPLRPGVTLELVFKRAK
jgi:Lipocalin-like domain